MGFEVMYRGRSSNIMLNGGRWFVQVSADLVNHTNFLHSRSVSAQLGSVRG